MALARRFVLLLLSASVAAPVLHAEEINWQEAVARLARERTLAETCAGLLKKYGDKATQARLSGTYGEAKAEYDGVIAGLAVALSRKEQPESLKDLQARLQSGFDKRETFCRSAWTRWALPKPCRAIRARLLTLSAEL